MPEVVGVVKELKECGIRPILLTGDRPETVMKIAEETEIVNGSDHCLDGESMARMDLTTIAGQSDHISVHARLLPSKKGILVGSLPQRNGSVAMVGDGANDTIALKVADVGVSFKGNSYPFARRISKIQINDLADPLTVIRSARRMKWRSKHLMYQRSAVIASVFFVLYLHALNLIAHPP